MKNLKSKILNLILACCLILTANIFAFTNYVWQSSPSPTPPYDTWATAAHNIQDAVNSAVEGNVVMVTNGVYTLSSQITIATNNVTLKSVNGAGDSTIDGNFITRCVYINGSSTIDGFLIRNAYTIGNGGGVFAKTGGTILNCTITNNVAKSSDYGGGGVYVKDGLVSNCYFRANIATNGAGVYVRNNSILMSSTMYLNEAFKSGGGAYSEAGGLIYNCTLSSNNAPHYSGGGACLINGSVVSNCLIINNYAVNGGGVNLTEGGEIVGCNIYGNTVHTFGGGVYLNNGKVSDCFIYNNSSVYGGGIRCYGMGVINNCIVSNNFASDDGGGIAALNGVHISISDCIVCRNKSDIKGGGIYVSYGPGVNKCIISGNNSKIGGGIFCTTNSTVMNCLIYGFNLAYNGGGVYLKDGGEVINCTIAGNSATGAGGGICTSNGGTVVNSIIYKNSGYNNWKNYADGADYSYSCTRVLTGLPGGVGCTTNDPLFVNDMGNDYHLQIGSPCIDAGTNMAWMTGATDLDGNPRRYDGTVDMGCYEDVPEPFLFIIYHLLIIIYYRNRKLATRNS